MKFLLSLKATKFYSLQFADPVNQNLNILLACLNPSAEVCHRARDEGFSSLGWSLNSFVITGQSLHSSGAACPVLVRILVSWASLPTPSYFLLGPWPFFLECLPLHISSSLPPFSQCIRGVGLLGPLRSLCAAGRTMCHSTVFPHQCTSSLAPWHGGHPVNTCQMHAPCTHARMNGQVSKWNGIV